MNARAGAIQLIQLSNGIYAYARRLTKLMAFYDYFSTQPESIEKIMPRPIAFKLAVNRRTVGKRWPVLGIRPLEHFLMSDTKFFRSDIITNDLYIYVSKPSSKREYEEYSATAERCIALEPLAVWDAAQVEIRLLDHYYKRPNKILSHSRKKLYSS